MAQLQRRLPIPGLPASLWHQLQEAAGEDRLALVGGAVRDLLLHRLHRDPWLGLVDLDLVIEASAVDPAAIHPCKGDDGSPARRLADRLAQCSQGLRLCSFRPHGHYGTVEMELELVGASDDTQLDGGPMRLLLDVASARQEQYPIPAENPKVCFGRLEDDLARRDLTINAMALVLSSGQLLDPYGGQADLAARRLSFLHGGSLRDDPTRLVRAARYAARLGFSLDARSETQVRSTLVTWPWPWRPGDPPHQAPPALGTRLRMELELMLERENWRLGLHLLQTWGGLVLLDHALQADRHWRLRLARAERFGLPRLAALLAAASDPLALAERLQLPHRQHRLLEQHLELRRRLTADLGDAPRAVLEANSTWSPSRWSTWLEEPGVSSDAVALALACGDGPRRPLLRWWLRWRQVKSPLSAAALMAKGVQWGPALGQRLRQLRAEQLDQERS